MSNFLIGSLFMKSFSPDIFGNGCLAGGTMHT